MKQRLTTLFHMKLAHSSIKFLLWTPWLFYKWWKSQCRWNFQLTLNKHIEIMLKGYREGRIIFDRYLNDCLKNKTRSKRASTTKVFQVHKVNVNQRATVSIQDKGRTQNHAYMGDCWNDFPIIMATVQMFSTTKSKSMILRKSIVMRMPTLSFLTKSYSSFRGCEGDGIATSFSASDGK